MTYTVIRVTAENLDEEIQLFLYECCFKLNQIYGGKYKWTKFPFEKFAATQYLTVCFRDGIPCGFLAASLFRSFFDPECIILKQNVLFACPGTRAATYLFKDFVDFGKRNANHVITMIGERTNISRRSLERLGFTKLEELYRLETTEWDKTAEKP